MQNSNQMRFAIAMHILQRSNPATRQALESKRAIARRHPDRSAATVGSASTTTHRR